jgi:hypothetical protein
VTSSPGSFRAEVYVANADGSSPVKLVDGFLPSWQPRPGPSRSDSRNAAQFCKAERDFLGGAAFAKKYGNNGKCVSQNH